MHVSKILITFLLSGIFLYFIVLISKKRFTTKRGKFMRNWRRKFFLLGAVIVIFTVALALNPFSATFVAAQDEKPKKDRERKALELETMTVTAQKREENIQEIPASITALSEIQIEDAGIKDMEDLTYYTPNLHINKIGNHAEQYPIIRGMFNRMTSGNPTVGVFVDGVAYSRCLAYDPDLYDIERIEVLKGP